MKEILSESRASLICLILAGSWRRLPTDTLDISEAQLDAVTPLLYGSGSAALSWRRVRDTDLKTSSSAKALRQAYRIQMFQSTIHEEKIKTVFGLLRGASIEPILIKGWAAASLYPERALRPYGDIDLCVRPSDYDAASAILAASSWIDLHRGIAELQDRSFDQLFERSRLAALGDETARVLAAEDHLALLAIHLLKHGAWRPLWLCDIGAAIESLPPGFDWDICLGQNKKRASWIACAVRLAQRLLRANIREQPGAVSHQKLPQWLVNSVLKQWETPLAINQPPMSHPLPIIDQLCHPNGVCKAIRDRWPNPTLATISVNGRLSATPRLPYQLANCVSRVAQFLVNLPRELRD